MTAVVVCCGCILFALFGDLIDCGTAAPLRRITYIQHQQRSTTPSIMHHTREKPPLRNILISGGTGFVGSAIARAVAEQHPKCTITVLDCSPPNSTHELPDNVAFTQADVTVYDTVYNALQQARPEIVIHTAGIVPGLSERFGRRLEQLVRKTNIEGTRNMLDAARQAGVKGFVYTSTCCVVTDDMSTPYENIDEQWPIPSSSLIYGESKVVSLYPFRSLTMAIAGRALLITPETGCGRKNSSRSQQQHNGHLLPPTLRAMRPRRPSTPPAHPQLHLQM